MEGQSPLIPHPYRHKPASILPFQLFQLLRFSVQLTFNWECPINVIYICPSGATRALGGGGSNWLTITDETRALDTITAWRLNGKQGFVLTAGSMDNHPPPPNTSPVGGAVISRPTPNLIVAAPHKGLCIELIRPLSVEELRGIYSQEQDAIYWLVHLGLPYTFGTILAWTLWQVLAKRHILNV